MSDTSWSQEKLPEGKNRCPRCSKIHDIDSSKIGPPKKSLDPGQRALQAHMEEKLGSETVHLRCPHCGTTYMLTHAPGEGDMGQESEAPQQADTSLADTLNAMSGAASPAQPPVTPPVAVAPAHSPAAPGQVALPATAKILSNLKLAGIFNIVVGILSLLWAMLMPPAIMPIAGAIIGRTPQKKISPSEFWNYAANGHIVGTIIVREKEIEGTLVDGAPGLKKGEPRKFVVEYAFSAESDFDERLQKALKTGEKKTGNRPNYKYDFARRWEGLLPQLLVMLVMLPLSAACGIVELVAGIKLLKRAPGARKLGLISGFASCASVWGCCVYPFCLAAGIFTLILLFKEQYRVFLEQGRP